MAEEATINPDGSTTFEHDTTDNTMPPVGESGGAGDDGGDGSGGFGDDETMGDAAQKAVQSGIDPAFFLLIGVIVLGIVFFLYRRKAKADEDDEFFSNLDGEKVSTVLFRINSKSCRDSLPGLC
jgi:cbb3-type cytochrome oxidase subunit 3